MDPFLPLQEGTLETDPTPQSTPPAAPPTQISTTLAIPFGPTSTLQSPRDTTEVVAANEVSTLNDVPRTTNSRGTTNSTAAPLTTTIASTGTTPPSSSDRVFVSGGRVQTRGLAGDARTPTPPPGNSITSLAEQQGMSMASTRSTGVGMEEEEGELQVQGRGLVEPRDAAETMDFLPGPGQGMRRTLQRR